MDANGSRFLKQPIRNKQRINIVVPILSCKGKKGNDAKKKSPPLKNDGLLLKNYVLFST
ncbi:hypothetical protein M2132_001147 [Dysgonomonas sp. PH5-45]|nr:hypothetical protein [Dysgonomonas sp. PH5-45]MDH6387715.1 hypothetical protein [Dysgonomonas sp. PH5-37]